MSAARKLIAEKRGTPKAWPYETDESVTLQCEVSEARELLKVSEHDENSKMSQSEWDRRVTEFLERNKESQ